MDKVTIRKILKKLYRAYKTELKVLRFPAAQIWRELGIKDGTDLLPLWNSNLIKRDERENIYISEEGINYMDRVFAWYGKLAGRVVNGEMENRDKEERAFAGVDKEIQNEKLSSSAIFNIKKSQLHFGSGDNVKRDKIKFMEQPSSKPWWQRPEIVVPIIIAVISIPWWPQIIRLVIKNTPDAIEQPKESSVSKLPKENLRPLETLETGKRIGELPNNVYFFGSPIGVVYEINDPKNDFLQVTSRRLDNYSFEIQKLDNRYYLIGFISDEIYSRIGSVNSENSIYAVFFPNMWGGAPHPVAIPFDAVYTIQTREIDLDSTTRISVLDIGFKEVIDRPETHSN